MKNRGRGMLVVAVVLGAFMAPPLVTAAGLPFEGPIVDDANGSVEFDASRKKGSKVKNIDVEAADATCAGQPEELNISYKNATVKKRGKFSVGNDLDFFKGTLKKNATASGKFRFNGLASFGENDDRLCETGVRRWEASFVLE